jgi:hypothetical protein
MTFDIDFSNGLYAGLTTPTGSLGFPEVLDLDSASDLLDNAPENAPLLGVDGAGDRIDVDLDNDSPHVLISAASGGGKSVIVRSIATQILCNKGTAVFLDLKRHSHRWAKGLPQSFYAQTVPEIMTALVKVGIEVHRRNAIVEEFPGPIEEAPVGERIVVVFEEMNATTAQLKTASKRVPETEYGALDALRDIMFMGRAAKVHLVGVAQLATFEAMGGSAILENFNTKIMLRYSPTAWRYLARDCGNFQAAPEEKGRGIVCRSGKARKTQFLYLTEEQAAQRVRTAYAQRVASGEVTEPSRRERRHMARNTRQAAITAAASR